jgi:hypothetical protein
MRLSMIFSLAVLSTVALAGTASAQYRGDAPRGSYLNSCRSADERNGVLYAECRDSSGQYRRTSLSLRGCSGDIANERGNLYCRGGEVRYDGDYDRDDRYRDRRYDDNYASNNRRDRRNNCDVGLGTGLGALGGAGIGAAVNRGNDTGAAIGGAIIGAILGNAIARDQCDDNRYDAYYYERSRYDSVYNGRNRAWRNPHTGAYGDFRVTRTYRDYGYWDDNRWRRVNERQFRRNRDNRYSQVTCREYVETYGGRSGRRHQQSHIVCNDGSSWRYVG